MTDATVMISRARDFARDTLAPNVEAWERARQFPLEAFAAAAEAGLTAIETPSAFGGLGLPFSVKAEIAEILGGVDFGLAMAILNTQNVAAKITRDAPRGVAERYVPDILAGRRLGCTALTEPSAGSDFAAITTRAERDSDGWVLHGEKAWIINAAAADVIVLYAQTEPGSGGKGIAAFLIDGQREGFRRLPAFDVAGEFTIGSGGFRLDGYRASADELLQPPGQAFKSALGSINGARIYVAAMCCGMVASCLKTAAVYGRARQTFGKRLVDHQGWRWALAEAETDLAAARIMVREAASLIDNSVPAMTEAARTKIFATRMATRHIPALAQLMGAEGLRSHYPFGRHQIGARMASFTDGSTEMLLERLAAAYLKD
ncbi:MAG: acyl-CoA dehydrogenase family protein [Pseudomonadota bacterium]